VFTYGGATPPATPTIDTLANEGVRFRNTWSMPACSTSRSVIYTGRFPFRTRVYGALGPSDLANSQVSPYELTLPKLLHNAHYKSALFGKFHLGLQGKNPFRDRMPHALGWDYFYGWLDDTGDPSSIDTTAGNVAPVHPVSGKGPYGCGFVPSTDTDPRWGADVGACYAGDGSCQELQTVNGNPPGRQCRDGGGIFDRNQSCNSQMPANIRRAFDNVEGKFYNAHYVSPLVINDESGGVTKVPSSDLRARTYRGSVPVDAAIDWIKSQPKHQPWMASVSFASAHTPIMQPPQALIADDEKFGQDASKTSALTCVDEGTKVETAAQRAMTNMMITAMDAEIGRLLESTGLARRAHDGTLKYNSHNNDTMVVIVGDNGTLGNTVKLPFDGTRAKGTAYQTGVWVPLIVAGPLVKQPDRDVRHMVNIADLYQLFGEIAGIDVPGSVPRRIDAVSMLPYLKNPTQASLREWNYTEVAPNLQPDLTLNPPCVINTTCTQIPVTASVCTDNGGTWYEETLMNGKPKYPTCCSLNTAMPMPPGAPYSLQPLSSEAVRNEHYKLVKNRFSGQPDPSKPQSCGDWEVEELYEINERKFFPKIDREGDNLKSGSTELTRVQKANLLALRAKLAEIRASEPPCPGDGNIDGQVNENDVTEWAKYAALPLRDNYNSSWYDFNFDGLTDDKDLLVIRRNLGNQCVR
jgi:arylsulfatase A-like enzyme